MRKVVVILSLLAAGCSTFAGWQPLPWAKVTVDQAWAECRADNQRNPFLSLETCMESRGYRAIYQ